MARKGANFWKKLIILMRKFFFSSKTLPHDFPLENKGIEKGKNDLPNIKQCHIVLFINIINNGSYLNNENPPKYSVKSILA